MAQEHSDQPGSERQLLTQKEYADRKGWSKQYVNQLVKKGRIPLQGGKIDPVVADATLARDRDPTRAPPFRTDSMAQATPVWSRNSAALSGQAWYGLKAPRRGTWCRGLRIYSDLCLANSYYFYKSPYFTGL